MKMILVTVSNEHQNTLLTLKKLLAEKYMPFCYVNGAPTEIPDLGEDYSSVYGYTQTHDTLKLWLYIWKAHDADVRKNGTSQSARCFIDMATVFWNKCMGNVDTVRRIIREATAKRGRNSGPGSLYWFVLLDYILFQAFRHYQHGQMESKLDKFKSFKQYQQERKRISSYQMFLNKLKNSIIGLD